MVFGTNPNLVWKYIMIALQCLVEAGFMLNLKKSELLTSSIKMLGFWVSVGKRSPCCP